MSRSTVNVVAVRRLSQPGGHVHTFAIRLGLQVRNGAVQRCNVRTGLLRSSIAYDVTGGAGGIRVRVGSPLRYAYWVHQGRGAVYPRTAQALRWVTPSGRVVYAPRAGPYAGNPFLKDAMEDRLGVRAAA